MKIFITGINGYIGSVLRDVLIERGHQISGVDTGYYSKISSARSSSLQIINQDIRTVTAAQLIGYDAVIHLADLSNDPLGMINESLTREINYHGAVRIAKMAKAAGVSRYVYSSSCSVYGNHGLNSASELSQTIPLTMYAKCKLDVEQTVRELADSTFSPVFLRNSTVYGISPHMRFDLVVNKFAADAFLYHSISIDNGGSQWRPLVHILDVCRAFTCAVETDRSAVHNEVYNVGARNGNYTISHIGDLIHKEFPNCAIMHRPVDSHDLRSYQVSFDKIYSKLPGFFSQYTVEDGVKELHRYFIQTELTKESYVNPEYTRVKQMKYLLETKQLDDHFYWMSTGRTTSL